MKDLIFEAKYLVTVAVLVSVVLFNSVMGITIVKGVSGKVEKRVTILKEVIETGKIPTSSENNNVKKVTITCGVRG